MLSYGSNGVEVTCSGITALVGVLIPLPCHFFLMKTDHTAQAVILGNLCCAQACCIHAYSITGQIAAAGEDDFLQVSNAGG